MTALCVDMQCNNLFKRAQTQRRRIPTGHKGLLQSREQTGNPLIYSYYIGYLVYTRWSIGNEGGGGGGGGGILWGSGVCVGFWVTQNGLVVGWKVVEFGDRESVGLG